MKLLPLTVCVCLLTCVNSFAWDNPCYTGLQQNKPLPRMAESMVTLEPGRVVMVEGNVFMYDLGRETVIIKGKDYGTRQFLERLKKRDCAKGELVTLIPKEKSAENKVFDAIAPRP